MLTQIDVSKWATGLDGIDDEELIEHTYADEEVDEDEHVNNLESKSETSDACESDISDIFSKLLLVALMIEHSSGCGLS